MNSTNHRVFVSSTFKDLEEYRWAAEQVITWTGLEPEMVGSLTGLSESEVSEACRQLVKSCDLCVLIIGSRCGGRIAMHSFTSLEIVAADEVPIPLFTYIVRKENPDLFLALGEITLEETQWVANFKEKQRAKRDMSRVIELEDDIELFQQHLKSQLHEFAGSAA